MKNENHDEDKHNEEDPLTLAKLVSTWYAGVIVGFAVGNSKGNLTTAVIGAIIGATVSWIIKQYLMSKNEI